MVTIGYIIRIISAQCCYGVTPAVQCGNVGPRLEMENVTEEYNWTDIPEYNVAILVREFPLPWITVATSALFCTICQFTHTFG